MSILDGMAKSKEEMESSVEIFQETLKAIELSPEVDPVLKKLLGGLQSGNTVAEMAGITREEMEALFNHGCECMLSSQLEEATAIMTKLCLIDSIDPRYYYVLGGIHQLQGKYEIAGKLYVYALAFDATNPDTYLRLGECFLAAGEYQNALASFEGARIFALEGKGSKETLTTAEKMISLMDQYDTSGQQEASDNKQ